jgi:Caspase domain
MLKNRKLVVLSTIWCLILAGIAPVIMATENDVFKKNSSVDSNVLSGEKLQEIFHDLNTNIYNNDREYWAVLVGINNYPGLNDLPYSINEILSFQDTLLNGGNWNDSHIYVITDTDATKVGIFDAIGWLASNADEDDISIFYFVGHGSRNLSNECITSYDGSIYDDELDEKLDGVNGQIVVILDSCFSGGFIEELGKEGRIVLTACKKDEKTYQVRDLRSGIFGYFFNLSLEFFTKSTETTFLFTWFSSVFYSHRLTLEFDEASIVHPQMYDGTIGRTKLIDHHSYIKKFLNELFTMSIEYDDLRIWKM